MPDQEPQQEQTRLEMLNNAIESAREGVEREFESTANTWLACFGSKIFVVETLLTSRKLIEIIGEEKAKIASEKLEKLKERYFDLKAIYPDKNTIPPNEIKEELFEALHVLD